MCTAGSETVGAPAFRRGKQGLSPAGMHGPNLKLSSRAERARAHVRKRAVEGSWFRYTTPSGVRPAPDEEGEPGGTKPKRRSLRSAALRECAWAHLCTAGVPPAVARGLALARTRLRCPLRPDRQLPDLSQERLPLHRIQLSDERHDLLDELVRQ